MTARQLRLGAGERLFRTRGSAVLDWQVQRGAGLRLLAADASMSSGTDVALALDLGPLTLSMACRVHEVHNSDDQIGFSYLTLPGHALCGREDFLVEHDRAGQVWFRLRAVSRPATVLAQAGAPITRYVQRRLTTAYGPALRDAR